MTVEAYAQHLERPTARGHVPDQACTGAAGGAACGDLIRVSVEVDHDSAEGVICDAGFDASGCGAILAAGSAAVSLVRGRALLDAARVGAQEIARELGGLHATKLHAAELAGDALHRALGWAARRQARLCEAPARTLVAMSGGVDSAVAALLACERHDARGGSHARHAQGAAQAPDVRHPVVAVTLELWSDPENDGERSCCSAQAVRSARQIAHDMGLAHLSIDLREEFAAGVVRPWLGDHRGGLTPNPCVRCNGNVRLDAMLELAARLGAGVLATGHYARVCEGLLRVALDERKDQSYALAALSPSSLERMRFPLGSLTKAQVREHARRAGLAVAQRADSQDLCFLAGTDRQSFLARHGGIGARRGPIVDLDGQVLGEHAGVHTVTIGQRRGLGISGAGPSFVLGTDLASNTVVVGPRARLRADTVNVRDVTLHQAGTEVDAVKVRYRGSRMACRLREAPPAGRHDAVQIDLAEPAERTAPGQVACLYSGELIVGHGTIA